MTVIPGVSLLGNSNAQINRLNQMRRQMDDLERQVGTQKKYDTLAGFGISAQTLLQLHADRDQIETYVDNIEATLSNIKTMSDAMTSITKAVNQMVSVVQNQPQNGQFDASLVNSMAQQTLDLIASVANLNITGRYIFAGTDSQTAPVANVTALNTNMSTELTNWLSGANTTNQLIANTDGFSGTALGFSSSISSAQSQSIRIDNATEVSYGAIADRSGIQDALRAVALMANLRAPNPATDVPNNTQFGLAIDHILSVARTSVTEMNDTQSTMNGALTIAQAIQDTHKQDINLLSSRISDMEDTDTTEVITMLQTLQTQLTSSYEVTRIVSQLSLANFIG
jgi:flagellar hook-associated protein 3 FlgL